MDWGYLTFEVRVSGVFDDVCKPSISITKRWPSYGSNVVASEGDYIDGGSTSDTDWRRVVIPITEFATEEWPNLDGVKDMCFRTCGTAYSDDRTTKFPRPRKSQQGFLDDVSAGVPGVREIPSVALRFGRNKLMLIRQPKRFWVSSCCTRYLHG